MPSLYKKNMINLFLLTMVTSLFSVPSFYLFYRSLSNFNFDFLNKFENMKIGSRKRNIWELL